ncbi:MAG: tetratricopeptide repeat protein [Gemmatimonadetes bacterium]|nr:tetratricopeptide repeat protein [Gemmatimonadota bacterium]
MSRSEATVEELLGMLPALDELEVLRLRLIRAASPDSRRAWDSSSAYATVDKRILTPEDVERSVEEAEAALRDYVASLHDGLRPLFRSFFTGDADSGARHLVALGEHHENDGRVRSARECYRAALRLSLPLPDKGAQVLALRRIARVSLALGDFRDAVAHYDRSAELARHSGDLHAEVVARIGAGNVSNWQDRWPEAERSYLEALRVADEAGGLELERGQIFNNLGSVTTRLQRADEAEEWFQRALAVWNTIESPLDLSVCLHNQGHLRALQGRRVEARATYERALALPVPSSLRALISADIAELLSQEGHLTLAEDRARAAEEHAIASGSPYALGRMYYTRGNLARVRGDVDGFTFFEKALEIARDKGYPYLEAETLAQYADLRLRTGGVEEAQAYLERARDMFRELGATQDLSRAEEALARICSPEASLAATGD